VREVTAVAKVRTEATHNFNVVAALPNEYIEKQYKPTLEMMDIIPLQSLT
jgi:hypothetical protein